VKVVAYQWGQMAQSTAVGNSFTAVPSADPVTQTFYVEPVGEAKK
jgi:hypothetical protein